MAVIVDKAIWPYKGKLWAHLASDKNLDELHSFAELLGLRLMSFQGDHYDIPEEVRDKAIELGAEEIDGRDLLSRLKKAELVDLAKERGLPHSGTKADIIARLTEEERSFSSSKRRHTE